MGEMKGAAKAIIAAAAIATLFSFGQKKLDSKPLFPNEKPLVSRMLPQDTSFSFLKVFAGSRSMSVVIEKQFGSETKIDTVSIPLGSVLDRIKEGLQLSGMSGATFVYGNGKFGILAHPDAQEKAIFILMDGTGVEAKYDTPVYQAPWGGSVTVVNNTLFVLGTIPVAADRLSQGEITGATLLSIGSMTNGLGCIVLDDPSWRKKVILASNGTWYEQKK